MTTILRREQTSIDIEIVIPNSHLFKLNVSKLKLSLSYCLAVGWGLEFCSIDGRKISIMKVLTYIAIMLSSLGATAQIPHEHPDHPRGNNSNDQYEALSFYNEACELYANGEIGKAKRSLKEAINTSFALTEAQLFLADILYDEDKKDSAFIYYNSGIDFATHQKPRYYFRMCETGMLVERYDVVKHNLKHFKKYYGDTSSGIYEEGYPYTVDDYERYLASMDLVFDYNNWRNQSSIIDTLNKDNEGIVASQNDYYKIGLNKVQYFKNRRKGFKQKKSKLPINGDESFVLSSSGNVLLLIKTESESNSTIYFATKTGNTWSEFRAFPESINTEHWEGTPFFKEDQSLLYFSSNRSGNKDLYVAKVDLENNICDTVLSLWKINTPKDDLAPCWLGNTFYFASNGKPGFGGFDLYSTPNYSMVNGIIEPSNAYNMGMPYNSGKDELSIQFFKNQEHVVERLNFTGECNSIRMKFVPKYEPFDYEIKLSKLAQD